MIEVRQTATFGKWFAGLRDIRATNAIIGRIARIQVGLFGDIEPVGEGVSELRIHYGPGYRLYFVRDGKTVVILLCGGDKSTQARDIREAKRLAKEL